MVKSILGQIESKRARELEVPESAALSAVNTARPSSNPSNANHWSVSLLSVSAATEGCAAALSMAIHVAIQGIAACWLLWWVTARQPKPYRSADITEIAV